MPQVAAQRGSIFTGRPPHNNGLVGLAHIGWKYDPGEKTVQMLVGWAGHCTHLPGAHDETSSGLRNCKARAG